MTVKRVRLKSKLPKAPTWSSPRGAGPANAPTSGPPSSSAATATPAEERRAVTPALTTSKRRLQRAPTPLELLQQPLQAGVRKVFDLRRFLLVIGLTVAVLLLPAPPGLEPVGQRALALFVFTGAILILEPAPLPIAALMVPICQIALGIDVAQGAFAAYGNPVLFLILGSLFLAEALRKHGLTRRIALYAIVQSGGNFRRLLFGIMLITTLLSMWVLNTATTAVLIPVAISIVQHVQRSEDARRALALLVLGIAFSASIGGIATIMGSGENAIASGLLSQIMAFGFLDWMKYGLPVVVILLPLSWFLLLQTIRIPTIVIDTRPIAQEIQRIGGLSNPERETLVVLGISVLLWVAGSNLEYWLQLPATLLSSAVVAIGAVVILSIEEVIDWNDLKGVNWGVFFVIGSGLTLGDALNKSGASQWFADMLAPLLLGLPYIVILSALIGIGFLLTQFMNNVALGAILAPLLITVAGASGIAPVRLLIPTIFVVALAYTLPGASARMTLVSVTGAVEPKEMLRAGVIVGAPSALIILGFFYVLSLFNWI
ncbi:MAG: DASS family sodium-coupled anion symporter [Caldilineaceae bacterium]|nr:DASS family sodium-coupled anion symporter [Caldilineaceae bacterium]